MTDRELLELAAKAAGLKINEARQAERDSLIGPENTGLYIGSIASWWNPLIDSGDALRLAAACEMSIDIDSEAVVVCYRNDDVVDEVEEPVKGKGKQAVLAATRRAITRAAAEIGREMKLIISIRLLSGRTAYVPVQRIVSVLEPAISSQWHGVRAVVKVDGEQGLLESTEHCEEIAKRVAQALYSKGGAQDE